MSSAEPGHQLELRAIASRTLDGLEMGILEDGTSFLTGRGLAKACGVAPSVINQWANEYHPQSIKPRDVSLSQILMAHGYGSGPLYIRASMTGQAKVNAYPEKVCMAVLEYYAFIGDGQGSATAQGHFRLLARAGLRAFVYAQLGYDPDKVIPDRWRSYHERLLLNPMPVGYFSAFSETSHIVLAAIRAGLRVDSQTVPDISVGQLWSKHWTEVGLAARFGERGKYQHRYPDDYPQSAVVPEAFVYPITALGEFRSWLEAEYLPKKYPAYIKSKVSQGKLPPSRAELLLAAVQPAAQAPAIH